MPRYDAKTGERIYQERVAGQSNAFTASPVAADGKLYLAGEDGDFFVVKAGPKCELIATKPMGEVMMATPAISDEMIFVRTIGHIYGIAEASAAKQKAAK
jgi:outer membrane protein assembly factor BamB